MMSWMSIWMMLATVLLLIAVVAIAVLVVVRVSRSDEHLREE